MSKKRKRHMKNNHGWGDDYSEYYGHGYQPNLTTYKVKKGWDTGNAPTVCENCDWLPKERKQKILVNYEVWKTLRNICATVKVEWQALLTGTIDAEGVVHITGYYIPKQEVTSASVKNLDLIDDVVIAEKGIIAGVHSHSNMQCFFSPTDLNDSNMSLIKHHIVINNHGQYKAQSRIELPCGLVKFIDTEVFTVGEQTLDIVGLENIVERGSFVTQQVESKTNFNGKIPDGLRWCPVCAACPEEDSGVSCTCWTKGERQMLPDFTLENYVYEYGRTYKLKHHLFLKYGGNVRD